MDRERLLRLMGRLMESSGNNYPELDEEIGWAFRVLVPGQAIPWYTGDLPAALSLVRKVLPGYFVDMTFYPGRGGEAKVYRKGNEHGAATFKAVTAALAVCLAVGNAAVERDLCNTLNDTMPSEPRLFDSNAHSSL